MALPKILRGATFKGTVTLNVVDTPNLNNAQPYVIDPSWIVELHLQGDATLNSGSPVVLSTANSGEITLNTDVKNAFSYQGGPAKSSLLALGATQAIDVYVKKAIDDIDIFENLKCVQVVDPAN